jgi:hypothetical protein
MKREMMGGGASWRPGLVAKTTGRRCGSELFLEGCTQALIKQRKQGVCEIKTGCQSAKVYTCMHLYMPPFLQPMKTFSWLNTELP